MHHYIIVVDNDIYNSAHCVAVSLLFISVYLHKLVITQGTFLFSAEDFNYGLLFHYVSQVALGEYEPYRLT